MYLVRADGNAKIGAGHLMRCLTIIEELAKIKGTRDDVLFVCADEESASLARKRGFQAKSLGTDYRDMETELPLWETLMNTGQQTEQLVWGALNGTTGGEHVILVDSYYVTERYLQKLRRYGRIILLDDMQQKTYPVDTVVNYNVFAEEETYQSLYRDCETLLCIGGNYVPVRPQFLHVDYHVADAVSDVLITTGGGDVDNIAGTVLQAIYSEEINYHLISGRFNPHREKLEYLASECPNIHIYHDVEDMAGLMAKCDLAITAGGTTIYELAAIGVPFICFSYAENQEALTAYIGNRKVACFAGHFHKTPEKVLKEMAHMVKVLCYDTAMREAFFCKERQMIDGMGAERLARVLLAMSEI